ncbi:MAG: aminopeptidase P family protein [Bacteroidaceae bacterium]|nr:aminopeptidase P family protein [Bacteroidaceae bacterium]
MKHTIQIRTEALRAWMKAEALDAFIIPTADPHGSEYLPDYWKCRSFLTGFTGSAGVAVVTHRRAALWTDSRYFIQAAEELNDTPFELMREGEPTTPNIGEWLAQETDVLEVGATSLLVSEDFAANVLQEMVSVSDEASSTSSPRRPHFRYTSDPFESLWKERPALPTGQIVPQSEAYTSQTINEKRAKLTQGMNADDVLVLTDLSQIAWTLNLRGSDIAYNPVFLAYLLLWPTGGALCVDKAKLTTAACQSLQSAQIQVYPYDGVTDLIAQLHSEQPQRCWKMYTSPSAYFSQYFVSKGIALQIEAPLADQLKAIKDEKEQEGFRQAMERDGVALVQFRRWLDEALQGDMPLTEQEIDCQLTARRAAQHGFDSLSFGTIAAAGAHGAIVHYEAPESTETPIERKSFLLLDSGAQYDCGTTDITRTIPLGILSEEEKRVYTLVLKAHIGLARLRFPQGTNGLQADTAARAPLWQAGFDFGHGTGHGVGSHLCVHEGPHQIRKDKRACTQVPLQAGMTITDEPGIYLEGRFGVRLENVLLVRQEPDGFLAFEALTLCPFDTTPILVDMLTFEEKAYLNTYHAAVRRRLLPLLTEEADRQWLLRATESL